MRNYMIRLVISGIFVINSMRFFSRKNHFYGLIIILH